jgi:hypothetical protein
MDLLFMGGISVAWFGLIRLRAKALEPRKETEKAREGMKGSYRHVPRSHMGARVWEAARDQRLPVNSSWPINVTGRCSRFVESRKEARLNGQRLLVVPIIGADTKSSTHKITEW